MKRPFWLFLLMILAIFGSFAWLTRHPEAEILLRAESWPYVGPLASRFRELYRPATKPADSQAAGLRTEPPEQDFTPPRVFEQHVWALSGMELKQRASPQAPTLYEFDRIAKLGKIDRRGDWFHVYYLGREGWVLLEGYDENAEIPFGEKPDPPLPLPPRAPDEEQLAAARQFLRGKERVERIGPYPLYTDSGDRELISYLGKLAKQLDGIYTERYGRRPIGEPAEAVVLYQSDIAYRLLQRQTERIAGLNASGHNSGGLAVFYTGSRRRADIAATLVHELVHFINRRALGPHLPPWLDEGIADDLAQARIDEQGRILPDELGGERFKDRDRLRFEGGYAALWRLRDAVRDGSLPNMPELISSDWQSFVRTPEIQLHYAAAAFWIRYLLEGEDGRRANAFRAFLAVVAVGKAPTVETLQATLGEDWGPLNTGFRAWIMQQAALANLPDSSG